MVDTVDPDSVDFHPLFKSMNGAATTALHQDFPDVRIPPSPNPISRFEGDRSQALKNQYFSVDSRTPDLDVTDLNTTDTTTPNKYLHMVVNPLQNLAQRGSIKSLLILCTIFILVLFMTGITSNYFDVPGLNSSSATSNRSGRLPSGRQTEAASILSHQGISLAPPVGTKIPSTIGEVFADVDDLPMKLMDTAIYWHIPRSAGTTMKHILATCLGRIITTEIGGLDGHQSDEKLQMIRLPHGVFLNVDTTTPSGLKRAQGMGLAQSKMADVIFTPYVPEAAILFDSNHRGRFFTILREPVDRMISLYYYKRLATWEHNYDPAIKDQTLEDFIQTYGENWMVRTLTGCMSGPLQLVHLNLAKEILRRKFLIGILDEKTESLRRFEEYFGWKFPSPVSQTCKNNMFYFEWHSGNPHPPLEDQALAKKIRTLNMWDVALFEYGKQLFREQEHLFWTSHA